MTEIKLKKSKFKKGDIVRFIGNISDRPLNNVSFEVLKVETQDNQDVIQIQDVRALGTNKYKYRDLAKDFQKSEEVTQ